MTDNIESLNVVTQPPPDPPDGFGTQMPFAELPPYMQRLLRQQWNALAPAEQELVKKNLEDWTRADKRPDFSGPQTVGPIPVGADTNARKRVQGKSEKHQTYGNFETTISEDV